MEAETSLKEIQSAWHGTYSSYFKGFFASLLFTSLSFLIVAQKWVPEQMVLYVISALGVLQAIIQLMYFLKLGREDKPYWESISFLFMVLILVIIVVGTLWIIFDLNQRTMHSHLQAE